MSTRFVDLWLLMEDDSSSTGDELTSSNNYLNTHLLILASLSFCWILSLAETVEQEAQLLSFSFVLLKCTADVVWWYWGILALTLTLWQLSLLPAAFFPPCRTTPSFSHNLSLLSRNPWVLPAVFPPIRDPLRHPSGWFLCGNIFWNHHCFSKLL